MTHDPLEHATRLLRDAVDASVLAHRLRLLRIESGHDVGMREPCGGTDLAAKALPEQIGDIEFIIDDQDADCHGPLNTPVEGYWISMAARGRRIVNSVKAPSSLSTSIVPPCSWVTMS